MARMVRKQLNLDEGLDRLLAQRALELDISQSEVVRRAVEEFLHKDVERERAHVIEKLRAHWSEDDRAGVASGDRVWSREELHERPERRGPR